MEYTNDIIIIVSVVAIIAPILIFLIKEFIKHKKESNAWKEKHSLNQERLTNSINRLNDKIDAKFDLIEEQLKHKKDKEVK